MAKNDKVVKRGVYLYLDGSEIKNDIQSVEKEMRTLVSMQKKMVVGSEEYVRAGQKIRALKGIIAEHNAQLRETEQQVKKNTISFGKFVDGFNRFFGIIGAAIAALTGFTLAIRSLRDEKNKLEESQAGLQALTGLDNDSITWLTAQAKKLSTTMTKEGLRVRQSANEILDAFMLVGSAKPELLGNKEALAAVTEEAMRLQAAAKDITLNEAVDALTLSLNQYGDQADQAARYTNVLAAGSKAGAANIASQAKAIRVAGTAAAASNVPIEQTVGLIETLAYKGIKDEIAGTGLKRFFFALQKGAKETNPAVVGLDQSLENLKNKNMDVNSMIQMFGEEGFNAASVIIHNTDMVKQFTEAVTGTNIALEQSAINSNTAAAKLAQAKNELKLAGIELADRLNPAITVSTNMVTNLVKYLPGVLDWFKKWGAEILIVAGAFASYYGIVKAVAIYHTILNGVIKLSTTIKVAHGVVMLMLEKRYRMAATATTLYSKSMIQNQVLTKAIMAVQYLYAAAISLLHGRLKAAAVAMSLLNRTISINPIVAVVSVVTAAAGAFYLLSKRTTMAKEAYKELLEKNTQVRGELTKIYNSILATNGASQKRLDLIKEFNSKYGSYLSNLLSEKSTVQDITKAYNEAALAIQRKIAQEILDSKTSDIQSKAITNQADDLERITNILNTRFTGSDVASRMQQIVAFTEKNIAAGKSVGAIADAVGDSLLKTKKLTRDEVRDIKIAMKSYANNVKETAEQVNSVKKKLSPWLPEEKKEKPVNELDEVVITPDKGNNGGAVPGEDEEKKKERIQKELLAIEEKYALEREKLQHDFLSKRNMSQAEYEQFSNDLEEQSLKEKLSILGLEEKKRMEIQNKILALRDKFQKECAVQDEKEYQERQKSMEDGLELQLDTYKRGLQEQLYAGKIDEEEQKKSYLKYLSTLYDEIKDNPLLSDEFKNKMSVALSDKQLEEQKQSYDKAVENLNNLKNQYRDIGESFGEAMADFFVSEEKSLKEFLAKILVTVLDALEKQLIAEQAAAIGLVTIKEITLKGLAGIATAAAKIALITAAFETAKGVLSGFADGGYTGSGAWNEPKGIVHSNEFVSNRFAVSNPNLRPVFDLIDYAQRTGTVANLTGNDVAAVLSTGAPSGSTTPSGAPPSGQPAAHPDAAMIGVLQECVKVMRAVKDRFEQPLLSTVTVSGNGGLKKAMDEYDQLQKNIKR